MARNTDYYYKGYDITNKNHMEKVLMELQNPFGYNFESNARRVVDNNIFSSRTNQDCVKNKEYLNEKQ